MSFSYTRTREQLARMVLRKLGILASGGSDVSADMDIVYEAVDLRLKEYHRLGIMWRKVDKIPLSFTVSAGNNTGSATTDILFPIMMTIADNSNDEPVSIIGIREYAAIEDKTETGRPTKALWVGSAEFKFWPVPIETATAKLVYERIATDTTAGTAPDVDVSMLRWLKDIIAYDIADDFGQDEQKIQRLFVESGKAELNIRKLAVQRVDYAPVAVDDFDGRPYHRASDYGR